MVMRRFENWPKLLSAALRDQAAKPFVWGENDCLMFPANIVRALTGIDPAAVWRGKYNDEDSGRQLLEEIGGMQAAITKGLGIEPTDKILLAGRGDAALFEGEQGLTGGIVDDTGQRIAVPISNRETIVRIPLKKAILIWKY